MHIMLISGRGKRDAWKTTTINCALQYRYPHRADNDYDNHGNYYNCSDQENENDNTLIPIVAANDDNGNDFDDDGDGNDQEKENNDCKDTDDDGYDDNDNVSPDVYARIIIRPHHCEGFTGTRLSIGQQTHVVTVYARCNYRLRVRKDLNRTG